MCGQGCSAFILAAKTLNLLFVQPIDTHMGAVLHSADCLIWKILPATILEYLFWQHWLHVYSVHSFLSRGSAESLKRPHCVVLTCWEFMRKM